MYFDRFNEIDVDKDGKISVREYETFLKKQAAKKENATETTKK